MSNSVRANASASTRATIYHLCTGVSSCFALAPGECLLIEELGDLTIPGIEQIEVKAYKDPLTDQHLNFWNTLFNWCLGGVDVSSYARLILKTTQQFGTTSRLSVWNGLNIEQRIELLLTLYQESRNRFDDSGASPSKSQVLKLQEKLLAKEALPALRTIIARTLIESECPNLPELAQQIMDGRMHEIPISRRAALLNALIGFVCKPRLEGDLSWSISYEEFSEECGTLYAQFNRETRQFPIHAIDPSLEPKILQGSASDLFVSKIKDIEHFTEIPFAIRDFQNAIKTIGMEFRDYTSGGTYYLQYRDAVEQRFSRSYRIALSAAHSLSSLASQDFYDTTLCSQPPSFSGYSDSPDWFRNGVLHVLMNDGSKTLKWKLERLP